jgi:hypothetical protein
MATKEQDRNVLNGTWKETEEAAVIPEEPPTDPPKAAAPGEVK